MRPKACNEPCIYLHVEIDSNLQDDYNHKVNYFGILSILTAGILCIAKNVFLLLDATSSFTK
jgi:hypothetical protein